MIIPINLKRFYLPFSWMELSFLKVTVPLLEDSLLFTTKFQGVSATDLINLTNMRGWVNLESLMGFELEVVEELEVLRKQRPNHLAITLNHFFKT